MTTKKYGYARISSQSQKENSSLETQCELLVKAGVERDCIYTEIATGRQLKRPILTKVLNLLNQGDILVITKMDRLCRLVKHAYHFRAELETKKCELVCISEDVSVKTPSGNLAFALLAAVAEFESEIRAERVKAGMLAKKATGFKWVGKKPLLTQELKDEFYKLQRDSNLNLDEIAKKLGVSRQVLKKYLRQGYLSTNGPDSETKGIFDFAYYKNKLHNEKLK